MGRKVIEIIKGVRYFFYARSLMVGQAATLQSSKRNSLEVVRVWNVVRYVSFRDQMLRLRGAPLSMTTMRQAGTLAWILTETEGRIGGGR